MHSKEHGGSGLHGQQLGPHLHELPDDALGQKGHGLWQDREHGAGRLPQGLLVLLREAPQPEARSRGSAPHVHIEACACALRAVVAVPPQLGGEGSGSADALRVGIGPVDRSRWFSGWD